MVNNLDNLCMVVEDKQGIFGESVDIFSVAICYIAKIPLRLFVEIAASNAYAYSVDLSLYGQEREDKNNYKARIGVFGQKE